jgi:hypothetical protein
MEVGEENTHASMHQTMLNDEDNYYNQMKYGDARTRKDGSVTNYYNEDYMNNARKNDMYGAYKNYMEHGGTQKGFDKAARKSRLAHPDGGGTMRQVRDRDLNAYGGMLNFRDNRNVLTNVGRGDEGTRTNLFNSFFPGTYANETPAEAPRSYTKKYPQQFERGNRGELRKKGGILYRK